MNAQLHRRHEQLWTSSTTAIASLYHIATTKILVLRHRQQLAARKIVYWYRHLQLRQEANQRFKWLQTKQRARQLCASLVCKSVSVVWSIWKQYAERERARKAAIAERMQQGRTRWIRDQVVRIQRLHQLAMARRSITTAQLAPQFDPFVLRSLEEVARRLRSQHREPTKRELCAALYEHLLQNVSSWRAPEPHLRYLAKRYSLQLEALPATRIRAWLRHKRRHVSDSEGFLDLHSPFPTRTLEFLAQMSTYYALERLVSSQRMQVRAQYEARMVVREYLALLYANNQVLYTPATISSAQCRREAVEILQRRDGEEWMHPTDASGKRPDPSSVDNENASAMTRHAFTSFHCVWSDLCEKCLALQHHQSRTCACCGHRHSERSTAATPGHAASRKSRLRSLAPESGEDSQSNASASPSNNPQEQLPRLVHDQERCDFLVINAFFHALAPLEHENRTAHAPEVIWKLAMAHATASVAILYDELKILSLDSMLRFLHRQRQTRPDDAKFESIAPPQVLDKLLLLGKLLYDELLSVDQELQALRNSTSNSA